MIQSVSTMTQPAITGIYVNYPDSVLDFFTATDMKTDIQESPPHVRKSMIRGTVTALKRRTYGKYPTVSVLQPAGQQTAALVWPDIMAAEKRRPEAASANGTPGGFSPAVSMLRHQPPRTRCLACTRGIRAAAVLRTALPLAVRVVVALALTGVVLQTLPACDPEDDFPESVGKVADFLLPAGVAARADERQKHAGLFRDGVH